MKQRFFKTRSAAIKAAWLFCMMALLALELNFPPLLCSPSIDFRYFPFIAQFLLALPLNLLVAELFHTVVLSELPVPIPSAPYDYIYTWLPHFVAGYVQWFIVVPWLWRKWKAWKAQRA